MAFGPGHPPVFSRPKQQVMHLALLPVRGKWRRVAILFLMGAIGIEAFFLSLSFSADIISTIVPVHPRGEDWQDSIGKLLR